MIANLCLLLAPAIGANTALQDNRTAQEPIVPPQGAPAAAQDPAPQPPPQPPPAEPPPPPPPPPKEVLAVQEPAQPAPRAPTQAELNSGPFSYTYIQGDIIRGDGDGFSGGPDGLALSGAYALTKELFVFGGLGHLDGEIGGTDVDSETIGAGLGLHMPASPTTDLVFGLSLLHGDSENAAPAWCPDGTGYGLDIGLRHAADEKLELNGGVSYQDFEDSSSMTALRGGLVYHATKNVGICGGLSFSNEFDQLTVGVRWQP